jgi:O-antigen/teichoic acid export membrane protein
MSSSYLLIFSGTVGVIYYPKMASLIHDKKELRKYVIRIMGFVAFVSLLTLSIYYLNKEFILRFFFADGFERAGYLVRYQAIGDFFALLAYLLAYVLSARVETMKYIGAQAVSAIIYLGVVSLLIDQYNLEALTMAYMFRYIGFFFILVIFNRKLLCR